MALDPKALATIRRACSMEGDVCVVQVNRLFGGGWPSPAGLDPADADRLYQTAVNMIVDAARAAYPEARTFRLVGKKGPWAGKPGGGGGTGVKNPTVRIADADGRTVLEEGPDADA